MLGAEREVVVVRLEHAADEAGGDALGGDDDERARADELLLDPPGHGDVGQSHHVVAVHVGQEHGGEGVGWGAGLHQAHDGRAAGVELQGDLAVADERAGAGAPRPGVGHAGAGEDDLGGHSWNTVLVGVMRSTVRCCSSSIPTIDAGSGRAASDSRANTSAVSSARSGSRSTASACP